MLSGSAILRVVLLLVTAAILTGLVRYYWSHDGGLPETPLVAAPKPAPDANGAPRRAEPAPPPPRQAALPEPPPDPAPRSAPVTAPEAQPEPPPVREAPAAIPAAPEAPKPEGEQSVAAADENAGERAVDLVDLNTASLAQLNALKGGGAIGRAIIQHRPYTSVDQLLSKRVLSRTTFQRIKDQVTAR